MSFQQDHLNLFFFKGTWIFILSFLLCFVFCFVKLRFLFLVWLCCVFCFDGLCRMLWRVMMGWAKGNILLGLDRIAWPSALRLKMLSQWGWLQFCMTNKHFLTIVLFLFWQVCHDFGFMCYSNLASWSDVVKRYFIPYSLNLWFLLMRIHLCFW